MVRLIFTKNYFMKYFVLPVFLLFSFASFSQSWDPVESLPETASVRHHPITFSIGGFGYLVAGAKQLLVY